MAQYRKNPTPVATPAPEPVRVQLTSDMTRRMLLEMSDDGSKYVMAEGLNAMVHEIESTRKEVSALVNRIRDEAHRILAEENEPGRNPNSCGVFQNSYAVNVAVGQLKALLEQLKTGVWTAKKVGLLSADTEYFA